MTNCSANHLNSNGRAQCPLCSAGGVTQPRRVNSLTHKHEGCSNQSIINLLITDSWAVSINIKEAPCCFSAPLSKNIGFRGQTWHDSLFERLCANVSVSVCVTLHTCVYLCVCVLIHERALLGALVHMDVHTGIYVHIHIQEPKLARDPPVLSKYL